MTVLHRLVCFGALSDRSTFTSTDARTTVFWLLFFVFGGFVVVRVRLCLCACVFAVLKLSLPLSFQLGDEDPWKQMKWVGKPACCKVKGQLIESLENTYNFQKGFSLKYVQDA